MKVDMHVHTAHSRRPAIWLLKKIGCPESFTDPVGCYHSLKRMGMSHVTVTDHNTIDACLEIAHLPDTFISEEITAYFPEDNCKVHVLAYGINEEIHREVQGLRENIYDLCAYFRQKEITHAIAHAFSAVHERFTPEHFEKLLLLFKVFELNGDQLREVNDQLRYVLGSLTPEDISRLADRHGIAPHGSTPWRKSLISGSDDHSGTGYGGSFTRVGGTSNLDEFFGGIAAGRASVSVGYATGRSFARDIYSIAYQYIKRRFNLQHVSGGDILLRFADATLEPNQRKSYGIISNLALAITSRRQPKDKGRSGEMTAFIRREAARLIQENSSLRNLLSRGERHLVDDGNIWFEFVSKIANKTLRHLAETFFERLSGGQLFDLFHVMGSAGSLYLMLTPYFVAYPFYSAERRLARGISNNLRFGANRDDVRLACFTDSLREHNGVSSSVRRNLECALASDRHLNVITCYEQEQPQPGVRNFPPAYSRTVPECPQFDFRFPPLLELLDYCFEHDFSFIHAETPGPAGLCALAVAKILGVPLSATYHHAVADYVQAMTEDSAMSDIAWRYLIWFYNQADIIFVSSAHALNTLAEKGIKRQKLHICPRGVDCRLFNPQQKSPAVREEYAPAGGPLLLYVGRVARERGLEMLLAGVAELRQKFPALQLVICGDGPHRAALSEGAPTEYVRFTGSLAEEEVAALMASADLLVFPRATDSFANVVLEAQGAGLPVVLSDDGGPCERMRDGVTGRIFKGGQIGSLVAAVREMLTLSPERREEMRTNARAFAENFTCEKAFDKNWKLYKNYERPQQGAAKSAQEETENLSIADMLRSSALADIFGKAESVRQHECVGR